MARFWQIVRRNRWWVAACVASGIVLAIVATILATPVYRATSSVQIEQRSTRVLDVEELQPGQSDVADAERFLQTQIDVLLSRSIAIKVGNTLGLFRDTSFLDAMGKKFREPDNAADRPVRLRDKVISVMQENLAVALPRNSRVASISFYSRHSQLAARVANAYAETVIADNLERKFRASSYARSFLEQQLAETKGKLEASERAAITYARNSGLIDTGPAAGTGGPGQPAERARSLVTSSLVSMNDNVSGLRADQLRQQQRWAAARTTPLMNLPEVLGNPAVQELLQKRAELSADYQKELQTRQPGYPETRQVKAQLDQLNQQVYALATSIRTSILEGAKVADRQSRAALRSLRGLRAATLAEQQRSIQYNILRREVDTNRQLYEGLLQRYKEVGAAAGVTANNISVVDTAEPALNPTWPKPFLNLLFGIMFGLIAAGGVVMAREILDDAIRSPDDVEHRLGVTLLGVIPRTGVDENSIALLDDQRSALSEAYASLRTALEFASSGGVPHTMMITSSQPAEGKSTTSYAIARSLATTGRRVLLVDGDLRKPSLHKILGLSQDSGWSNVLNGTLKPAAATVATPIPNLSFMASGPLPPDPATLYARPSAQAMIDQLATGFDHVVIDGPPVLGLADAPLIASKVEGTVFLVDATRTKRGRVNTALRRLRGGTAQVLGVVLTKFDAKVTGYGDYGYRYDYGHQPEQKSFARRIVGDRF